MWKIWKHRCIKVFENKDSHPTSIITCIRKFCVKYNILSDNPNNNCRVGTQKTRKNREKPPTHWKKLNFDAAYDKNTKICGIGLVLRNCAGRCLEAIVKVTTARHSEQAESLALLEAVEWIKSKDWNNVSIERDCKVIIEAVTSNFQNALWKDHNPLLEISRLVESLNSVVCTFVPRTSNEAADGLAKYAKKFECNQVWSEKPPWCISSILELDNVV